MSPFVLMTLMALMALVGVSGKQILSLDTPVYLTAANSTDHNRYLGTVSVLKAILGQLQQINGKMGGNSNGSFSGKNISGPSAVVTTSELLVSLPLRDCPVPFRKRLLEELNARRAEEGLSPLTYDGPLSRQAHALATAQGDQAGSPQYSSDRKLRDYGQYASGLVVAASPISLQGFNFFAGWAGLPFTVRFSGQVEDMKEDRWKKVKAVGFACDAAQLSSAGKYKFWVAALFKD